jgi:hypothetical protein
VIIDSKNYFIFCIQGYRMMRMRATYIMVMMIIIIFMIVMLVIIDNNIRLRIKIRIKTFCITMRKHIEKQQKQT